MAQQTILTADGQSHIITAEVPVRVPPLPEQVMLTGVEFDSGYDVLADLEQTQDPSEAKAITSVHRGGGKMHNLVIDVDWPVHAIPSSTPGHFHLYVDKLIPWEKYKALLQALADAGIVEAGYAAASIDQGFTTVRAPWVRKDDA